MRIQKPMKGGRKRGSSSFARIVKAAIRAEARHWDCSESFVINNLCAYALKIPIKDSYK